VDNTTLDGRSDRCWLLAKQATVAIGALRPLRRQWGAGVGSNRTHRSAGRLVPVMSPPWLHAIHNREKRECGLYNVKATLYRLHKATLQYVMHENCSNNATFPASFSDYFWHLPQTRKLSVEVTPITLATQIFA